MNYRFQGIIRLKILRALTLIFTLSLFLHFDYITVNALVDTTGPIIETLEVNRTEATVGDTITYVANVKDDSGVSTALLYLSCGTEMKYIYLSLQEDGTYKGSLVVNNTFPNGIYKVDSAYVRDNLWNSSLYSADEIKVINPSLDVIVSGSANDTTGPVMESITFDATEATVGDTITFTINATDESGLVGAPLYLSYETSEKVVSMFVQKDGTLKGTLVIDNSFLNGMYKVSAVYLNDTLWNNHYYYGEELATINPNLEFMVTGSIQDTTGPIIDSLIVNRTEANVGDTITYTMQIHDEAGILEGPFLGISNGTNYITIRFELQDNGTYTGTFTIDNSFINGQYVLNYIDLRDKFNNCSPPEVLDQYANINFTLTGSSGNSEKPVIEVPSLSTENIITTSGDSVRVSISVTDDVNPIQSVHISYLNPIFSFLYEDYIKMYEMTYNSETQRYECIISLSDGLESGLWEAISITANIGMPNEFSISNSQLDLSAGNFIVPNVVPITGLVIDSTDINFVQIGEIQKLIATVIPSDATNKNMTWKSSDESVAVVSSDGTVTAVGNGMTTITVTTEDGNHSASCEVNVEEAPIILIQPTDQTVIEGQTANFSAFAANTPTLTILWEVSIDGGITWTSIPGATYTTLSLPTVLGDNGNKYRAIFTNSTGSATSNIVTLFVNPKIRSQITISVNNPDWGSASGSGQYTIGKNITVTALAEEGFDFLEWQEDGIRVSLSAEYKFKVGMNDRELVAVFQPSIKTWPSEIKLSVATISSDSVALSLNKPVTGAMQYVIYYESNRLVKPANEGILWNIDGLLKETKYTFTVQAIYDDLEETATGPSITIKTKK